MRMIPKIIHYCWFGGGPIPEKDQRCIESWKRYCPDYEIKRWDESNYDISKNKYMAQAFQEERWAFVSDYARLDVVYQYGGIYLDTDVELLKPLDPLLEKDAFLGIEEGEKESFLANLGLGFGSVPGCDLLKEMLGLYDTLSFIKDGKTDLTPSPQILTDYLRSRGYTGNNEHQCLDGVELLPTEYLCPQNYVTGKLHITPHTYSIHWYHASWKTEEEKKQAKRYQMASKILGRRYGEYWCVFLNTLQKGGVPGVMEKLVKRAKRQ
nr:glycosyltransferase [uncultured Intestinimonas sp.]